MAFLRSSAISLVRRAGHSSITKAIRRFPHDFAYTYFLYLENQPYLKKGEVPSGGGVQCHCIAGFHVVTCRRTVNIPARVFFR